MRRHDFCRSGWFDVMFNRGMSYYEYTAFCSKLAQIMINDPVPPLLLILNVHRGLFLLLPMRMNETLGLKKAARSSSMMPRRSYTSIFTRTLLITPAPTDPCRLHPISLVQMTLTRSSAEVELSFALSLCLTEAVSYDVLHPEVYHSFRIQILTRNQLA